MAGGALFVILLILVLPLAYVGYILYRRRIAQREGFTPPSFNPFAPRPDGAGPSRIYPAPTGILGWVRAKYQDLRGHAARRVDDGTAAYESTGRGDHRTNGQGGTNVATKGTASQRGIDHEDGAAWDTRFGADESYNGGYAGGRGGIAGEGDYYEEQQLGLHEEEEEDGDDGGYYQRDAPPASTFQDRGRGTTKADRSRVSPLEMNTEYKGAGPSLGKNPFGDDAEAGESLRGISPRPHVEAEGANSLEEPKARKHRSMFREGDT